MQREKKDRVNKTGSITLNLGEYFGRYVQNQLNIGRYVNASEVIREALREHENKRFIDDNED